MHMIAKAKPWLGLAMTVVATTVFAQKEQWLEYRTGPEGRGYRYLDVTTNPPPNVALPKFTAQPYFVRWTTPMDPSGGRWLCFDRVRKSGPYDRLYIDTKGDGRLDNKPPLSASRVDEYYAYFDPARMAFKGEDGPIIYHLLLRFMKFERSDVRVLAESGCYYSGMVDFGDKKRRLDLMDGNVNGAFNDSGSSSGDCDRVQVGEDRSEGRYLGKLIEVDGKFHRIEVARDGAFIKLQKADDVVLGQIRVPETISQFVARGENGHFVRKPAKGELTLPVGKYRVYNWTIDRKDSRGSKWQLMGYNFNQEADFEVTAGQPAAVGVGEPVRMALRATESTNASNNNITFNLDFTGPLGETIQILQGDQRPPGPKLALVALDGSYGSTNTFEFG